MYNWNVKIATVEKGTICVKVKANSKQEAIKKGFTKLENKGLTYANRFDCTMVRV